MVSRRQRFSFLSAVASCRRQSSFARVRCCSIAQPHTDYFRSIGLVPQGSELPDVKAILVLDAADGSRVATKFYSREDFPDKAAQADFERKLFKKTRNSAARVDAEVLVLDGLTVVFKSAVDVTFAIVGGSDENELILVTLLESLVDAVASLMKAPLDKRSLHNNLELLLLAIDEMVDGGVILEMDAHAIEARVMLRGAVPDSISSYKEMTVGALVDKARDRVAKQFVK